MHCIYDPSGTEACNCGEDVSVVRRTLAKALPLVRGRNSDGREWRRRGFAMPAPQDVKWAVLARYGIADGAWVETGTYLGDTTEVLARKARHVWSIEPEPTLAADAASRFAADSKVTIVNGTSEEMLEDVLDQVSDGPISLWLDGHYSAGVTFKGESDTPIQMELELVERRMANWSSSVVVLVDDVRCFDPSDPLFAGYPPREWLVEWAVRNGMTWTIEHDIFVARR